MGSPKRIGKKMGGKRMKKYIFTWDEHQELLQIIRSLEERITKLEKTKERVNESENEIYHGPDAWYWRFG